MTVDTEIKRHYGVYIKEGGRLAAAGAIAQQRAEAPFLRVKCPHGAVVEYRTVADLPDVRA